MAFGKWFRQMMLETCHLASIEDDTEREAFIQRIGGGRGDAEYLRAATDEVRARKALGTLYPGEVVLMKTEERARTWIENYLGPPASRSEIREYERQERKKIRKAREKARSGISP